MIKYHQTLVENYSIISIKDGLAEEDWSDWKMLTMELGDGSN